MGVVSGTDAATGREACMVMPPQAIRVLFSRMGIVPLRFP